MKMNNYCNSKKVKTLKYWQTIVEISSWLLWREGDFTEEIRPEWFCEEWASISWEDWWKEEAYRGDTKKPNTQGRWHKSVIPATQQAEKGTQQVEGQPRQLRKTLNEKMKNIFWDISVIECLSSKCKMWIPSLSLTHTCTHTHTGTQANTSTNIFLFFQENVIA